MVYIIAMRSRTIASRRRPAWARAVVPALLAMTCLAVAACGGAASSSGTARTPEASEASTAVYRWGVVGNRGKIAELELRTPAAVAGITGTVVQIATSNSDGYALTSAGQVYAWGVNSYGELGDGQLTPYETRAVRVDFPAGVKIAALPDPMPFDAGLAIDSTGHAWGWGVDGSHDLCLSGLAYVRPQRLPLSDVTLATGARTHALFYSHGTVYACGSGDAGELGNGSAASRSQPTPVAGLPAGVTVTALTSSWEGSGALLANGDYYDWGYNAAGQLGDGTTADSAVPANVNLPGPVSHVFQGGSGKTNGQTVAILKNGSVWAWGNNERGQLGDGTTANSDVPVRVHVPAGVSFVSVNSGGYTSFAIDSAGRLWDWGGNDNGQLGTGSAEPIATLPVDAGIRLTQVSSTASNVAGCSCR
jgi:alpha-tubulin suppressor-like RCC1 family protein